MQKVKVKGNPVQKL